MESSLNSYAEIFLKGKIVKIPSISVDGRTIIVAGKWFREARIHDEDWLPGEAVRDPAHFLRIIKNSQLNPDWFTFAQKFTDPKPRFSYPLEWDNIAAIPITSFNEWWERRVSHDLRKDVRRAEKRGIIIRPFELTDKLAGGIKEIYDETPIRQGRRFWHYGKNLESVKRENSSFLDRSEFIGAFLGDELVGFIKIVFTDDIARMMQIIAKEQHQDKRPMNALIAKAVEVAEARKCSYLTYGKYTYDNKKNSSVVQFKRRNGFEEIHFPRYYIPMSTRGGVAIKAGLHLGVKRFIPESVMGFLLEMRSKARHWRDSSNVNDNR
jgi:hypothetical protein